MGTMKIYQEIDGLTCSLLYEQLVKHFISTIQKVLLFNVKEGSPKHLLNADLNPPLL